MNHYVADTHALFWYLTDSPRLGPQANQAFDDADQGTARIYVPAIVLAELYYLNQKMGRLIDLSVTLQRLRESVQFDLLPFHPEDVLDFDANQQVPEMHDRIIVGVARRLNAALITRDTQIVGSQLVPTVW